MKGFRTVIFWVHLVSGLAAGLVIAVMSFTGVALAFEKQIIAWSEREARIVESPAPDATRLPLEQLAANVREKFPEARPASLVLENDPEAAVTFSLGRAGAYYADPYSGEIRGPGGSAVRSFMSTMVVWHRYFGFGGEQRGIGKAINGACNLVFLLLAVTGLCIWWPRQWSWRALKPSIWFMQNYRGKARDWNWHNAIGFWSAPVLIVLTATALPISYGWAGRLINTLTGTPEQAATGPGVRGDGAPEVPPPPSGAKPLGQDALIAQVQTQIPDWSQITMRIGGAPTRGGTARESRDGPAREGGAGETRNTARAETARTGSSARSIANAEPQAVSFTVRKRGSWPRTATTTVTLDPFTGAVLQESGFAALPLGRQVRSWTRYLHTGEALGLPGQFAAGLASLGGVFLVYTGFALAWRRFFGKAAPPASAVVSQSEAVSIASDRSAD